MKTYLGKHVSTYLKPNYPGRIIQLFLIGLFFLLLCTAMGCKREVRVLGDGSEEPIEDGPYCSNRAKDALFSWRSSLQNGTLGVCNPMRDCSLLAQGTLLDDSDWFYLVQIDPAQIDGSPYLHFTTAKIGQTDLDSISTYGDLFFPDGSPDEILQSDSSTYSNYNFLISIFSEQNSENDGSEAVAVVAVNNISRSQPFYRLQAYQNRFRDNTPLVQVDNRNIVDMTLDNEGDIIVVTQGISPPEQDTPGDFRIVKYDPTGSLIWDKSLPGQTNFTRDLVCDSQNSIFLATKQMPPPDSALAEVGSDGMLWLSKLDEAGEIIWEREIAEVGSANLALDQTNNVVLLATNYIYNRSSEKSRFHTIYSYEIWMSLFATDGEKQWEYKTESLREEFSLEENVYTLGTVFSEYNSIVVDRDGSPYLALPIENRSGIGPYETLLVQFTPLGRPCAVRYIDEAPVELMLSDNDELYFNGKYSFGHISRD